MAETQGVASAQADRLRGRSGTRRALEVLRLVIWVYGGFLLGVLTHAWWSGDDDLVFWPWSLAFVALLAGWLVLQRREARVVSEPDLPHSS